MRLRKMILSLTLCTAFSLAEATWSEPVIISDTNSDQPEIAVDASGNATAVWQGYDGNNYIIQAASLAVDGSWGSIQTLSDSGEDAQSPNVGCDSFGNVVAVWSRYDGTNSIIQNATLPIGGSWSSAGDISEAGENADSPSLSVDLTGTSGMAVAVWHRFDGSNFIVQAAGYVSGQAWSPPMDVSPTGQDALIPQVAIDPNGNGVASCSNFDGSNFTSRSAISFVNPTWDSPVVLSNPGQLASAGSVAVDSNGDAAILWSQYDGSNYTVQASTCPFGGSWTTPVTISTSGLSGFIPIVQSDPSGNLVALWIAFDGTNLFCQASNMPVGGSWTTPLTLSNSGQSVLDISLVIDSSGNALAVWDESDGTNSVIQSASLPFSGSWSALTQVSADGDFAYQPVVAVDGSGNAVSIWLQEDEFGDSFVYASNLPFGT